MSKLVLYHGSPEIIEKPIYGKGKAYNDYGKGFYCTEILELAKEWACTEGVDGYANQYEIEIYNLRISNLSADEYTILHFLVDIDDYDAIIGYRADDSYFAFARAFVNNEISLGQLSHAMRLGKSGEQFVLKSPKAFESIKYVSYKSADNTVYYARRKVRDDEARVAFFAELEKEDIDGLYMRDIIREEVKADDPRLR